MGRNIVVVQTQLTYHYLEMFVGEVASALSCHDVESWSASAEQPGPGRTTSRLVLVTEGVVYITEEETSLTGVVK